MGGRTPDHSNIIDFFTIATLGNADNFGDLTEEKGNAQSASDCIRGVRMGGSNGGSNNITMDYINIATRANAEDFGDLATGQGEGAGCSNAHGGL